MALDATSCCRVCLKSTVEGYGSIELQNRPEVIELIQQLYGLKIKRNERGSSAICFLCYKDAADLRKFLTFHEAKSKLVTLNQGILAALAEACPDDPEEDEANLNDAAPPVEADVEIHDEPPPSPSPQVEKNEKLLIQLEDCMRNQKFLDSLRHPYKLGYLRVSGMVFQKATGDFEEVFHPLQHFCLKCRTKFDTEELFNLHLGDCKWKCIFCKRTYRMEESYNLHGCPKRDKFKPMEKGSFSRSPRLSLLEKQQEQPQQQEKEQQTQTVENPPKRRKVTTDGGDNTNSTAQEGSTGDASAAGEGSENLSIREVANSSLSTLVVEETTADADNEPQQQQYEADLSSVLERWYGQTEEMSAAEANGTSSVSGVGVLDCTPAEAGLFTNSELYNRIIDTAYRDGSPQQRPAISVKPISELLGSPIRRQQAEQRANGEGDEVQIVEGQPMEVIEIDDDDDTRVGASSVRNMLASSTPNQPHRGVIPSGGSQTALNERDILNIVKQFRGIDENESYLIKAKINGSQKLICISKRKTDRNQQEGSATSTSANPVPVTTSVTAASATRPSNSNSALQAGNRRSAPAALRQTTIPPRVTTSSVTAITRSPGSVSKQTPVGKLPSVACNGTSANKRASTGATVSSTSASVPQLKIAHVQSLVSPPQQPNNNSSTTSSELGKLLLAANRSSSVKTPAGRIERTSSGGAAASATTPVAAAKQTPPRIIVGSNSIKMLNNNAQSRAKIAAHKVQAQYNPQQPVVTPTSNNSSSNVEAARKRIEVIRKSVSSSVAESLPKKIVINKSQLATAKQLPVSIMKKPSTTTTATNDSSLLRTQLLQQPAKMYPSSAILQQQQIQHQQQNGGSRIMMKSVSSMIDQVNAAGRLGNHQDEYLINETTIKRIH